MRIKVDQALALAGDLEDEDVRARFRHFLKYGLKDLEDAREFLGSCLGGFDDQHQRALWDLICHLGAFLGFEVDFEGRWISPKGVVIFLAFEPPAGSIASTAIVRSNGMTGPIGSVESLRPASTVGPLDLAGSAGPVESATPAGYERFVGSIESAKSVESVGVDALVSKIESIESEEAQEISVGLYVVCATDLESAEEAVIEGDETGQIRAVSAESLLTLAEMVIDYDLDHEDALLIILSSGALVDPLIDLMGRIIAKCEAEIPSLEEIASALEPLVLGNKMSTDSTLQDIIEQGQYYAFGNDAAKNKMLRR